MSFKFWTECSRYWSRRPTVLSKEWAFLDFLIKTLWNRKAEKETLLLLITTELSMTAQNSRNITATVHPRLLNYWWICSCITCVCVCVQSTELPCLSHWPWQQWTRLTSHVWLCLARQRQRCRNRQHSVFCALVIFSFVTFFLNLILARPFSRLRWLSASPKQTKKIKWEIHAAVWKWRLQFWYLGKQTRVRMSLVTGADSSTSS